MEVDGLINQPLKGADGNVHGLATNKEYVISLLIESINLLFPNLNKVQIEAFVWKLFNSCQEWTEFKSTLRDLLISMKSFSSSNDDFYEEERKVRTYKLTFNLLFVGCTRGIKEERSDETQCHPGTD